ncbi:MAG: hypothetical protein IPJ81_07890 [Chitinophagaceae bacterium]|nr:hypothetical protein [Chitinophagaceae bacterium]
METSFQPLSIAHRYKNSAETASKISSWKKIINYAEKQEKSRILWTAIGILGHGTIFTIVTLMAIVFTGNLFPLYVIAICNMVMVVVVNLAALPTKYTVPIFFISLLIDCGVIISALLIR